jgi:hypothetical protein
VCFLSATDDEVSGSHSAIHAERTGAINTAQFARARVSIQDGSATRCEKLVTDK